MQFINNKRGLKMNLSATFDTLDFVNELKKGGIKQEEAEAITNATKKAMVQILEVKEVATKLDIHALKLDIANLQINMQKFMFKTTLWIIGSLGGLQALLHFFPGK